MCINYSGLVRSNNPGGSRDATAHSSRTKRIETNSRQMSINSINSEIVEEEKYQRENSINEKQSNIAMVAPTYCSLTRVSLRATPATVSERN